MVAHLLGRPGSYHPERCVNVDMALVEPSALHAHAPQDGQDEEANGGAAGCLSETVLIKVNGCNKTYHW